MICSVLIVPFASDIMAGDYSRVDTVKALSEQEVNKLTNPQLKKALWTILTVEEVSEQKSFDLLKTLITNQEKHFQIMLNTMKETANIQQLRTESEIFDLHKRCDTNDNRITELTNKLEQSESYAKVLESKLSKCHNELDEMESYVRRPCLVINNLKPEDNMSDEEVFIKLCKDKEIDPDMSVNKIAKIHRLHRPNNMIQDPSKPQSLIVKFAKDRYRDVVFKNKKKLKGSGTVISELLTSKRSALFKKCLERIPGDRNTRSIWTDNCKILVKFGRDQTLQIHSEEDINKLICDRFPQTASSMSN